MDCFASVQGPFTRLPISAQLKRWHCIFEPFKWEIAVGGYVSAGKKKTAIKGNIGLTSHGLAFSSRGQSVRGGGREHERDDEEERERRYRRHRRRE